MRVEVEPKASGARGSGPGAGYVRAPAFGGKFPGARSGFPPGPGKEFHDP